MPDNSITESLQKSIWAAQRAINAANLSKAERAVQLQNLYLLTLKLPYGEAMKVCREVIKTYTK